MSFSFGNMRLYVFFTKKKNNKLVIEFMQVNELY